MFKLVLTVLTSVLTAGVLGRIVPTTDDPMEIVAQTYCQGSHAEDKVAEVDASLMKFQQCVEGSFDTEAIKMEFAMASYDKSYDQFFKKHCTKAPQLKACISALVSGVAPCLPANALIRYMETAVNKFLDFNCDNEGARIASFFKEDGLQCIQEKNVAITNCADIMQFNATTVLNRHGGDMAAAMAVTDEERCSLDNQGISCMVKVMKECSNPTPGNLLEELRKTIVPCNNGSLNVPTGAASTTDSNTEIPVTQI